MSVSSSSCCSLTVVNVIYIKAIMFSALNSGMLYEPPSLSWVNGVPNTIVVVARLLVVRMVVPGSKSVENP